MTSTTTIVLADVSDNMPIIVGAIIGLFVFLVIVIVMGMDEPGLDEAAVQSLRRHIQAGGFLFINNTSGFAKFDRAARNLVSRIFPDPERKLVAVPQDHELLKGLYEIDAMRDAGTQATRPAQLEMVAVEGRAAIVYSRNDTLAMLKGVHDPYANAYDANSSRRLALNVLCYAMQN